MYVFCEISLKFKGRLKKKNFMTKIKFAKLSGVPLSAQLCCSSAIACHQCIGTICSGLLYMTAFVAFVLIHLDS